VAAAAPLAATAVIEGIPNTGDVSPLVMDYSHQSYHILSVAPIQPEDWID
jgi:hypothetical protein